MNSMKLSWNIGIIILALIFISCEKDERLNATENQNINGSSSSPSDTDNSSGSNDTDSTKGNDKLCSILVNVTNFKSSKGQLQLGLYNKAEDFPDKDRTYDALIVSVEGGDMSVKMDSIEAGNYALSVHHDENKNDKIDQNFMGVPQEGFGFSNNASGTFGPPPFDNAEFQLKKGQKKELSIKLQHY